MAVLIMLTTVPIGGALIEICGFRLFDGDSDEEDNPPSSYNLPLECNMIFDDRLIQTRKVNGRLIFEVTTELETVT